MTQKKAISKEVYDSLKELKVPNLVLTEETVYYVSTKAPRVFKAKRGRSRNYRHPSTMVQLNPDGNALARNVNKLAKKQLLAYQATVKYTALSGSPGTGGAVKIANLYREVSRIMGVPEQTGRSRIYGLFKHRVLVEVK